MNRKFLRQETLAQNKNRPSQMSAEETVPLCHEKTNRGLFRKWNSNVEKGVKWFLMLDFRLLGNSDFPKSKLPDTKDMDKKAIARRRPPYPMD